MFLVSVSKYEVKYLTCELESDYCDSNFHKDIINRHELQMVNYLVITNGSKAKLYKAVYDVDLYLYGEYVNGKVCNPVITLNEKLSNNLIILLSNTTKPLLQEFKKSCSFIDTFEKLKQVYSMYEGTYPSYSDFMQNVPHDIDWHV